MAAANNHPPVIFVRHGETDWNRTGIIQGWTDTPLNKRGHNQALDVAQALATDLDAFPAIDYVVSPMIRARQTMDYIRHALGAAEQPLAIEPRVKELGFGVWEGKYFWELKASPVYPADPVSRFDWRPEGGESYADGYAKLQEWVTTLTRPTLVVAHGAIGRCLIGLLAGYDTRQLMDGRIAQGCYCRLENGSARWFDVERQPA